MASQPLVTIIIPAFNADAVISAALDSILAQTYQNWNAIIINDGSTDQTGKIADAFSKKDLRFRVIHQENSGVSAARNAGLARADGEWIAFLDADDVWLPEKLSLQLDLARRFPESDLIFSNYFLWDGSRDLSLRYISRKKFPQGKILQRLIFFNLFGLSSVVLRQKILQDVGGFDETFSIGEDWDLWLRCLEKSCVVNGSMEPLLRYRISESSASADKLKVAIANVAVLAKRAAGAPETWRPFFRRSLQIARGNLEFAQARTELETSSTVLKNATCKAWRHCPSRLKWLLWHAGTICPDLFFGAMFRKYIRRKICERW